MTGNSEPESQGPTRTDLRNRLTEMDSMGDSPTGNRNRRISRPVRLRLESPKENS